MIHYQFIMQHTVSAYMGFGKYAANKIKECSSTLSTHENLLTVVILRITQTYAGERSLIA